MKYVRNPDAVKSQLVVNESKQVICKQACRIQVPVRFAERGLGQVGIDTFVYGLFPVILDNGDYSLCNVCAFVELNPFKVLTVNIDGVDYYEFHFQEGQVVIKTTDLVRRDTIMYNVFDELIFKGKVPWYVGYEDLGLLFKTAHSHAGSMIGENLEVIELLASIITRTVLDRTKYIRTAFDGDDAYQNYADNKITFVPLMSVYYSVNNPINKITGSYFFDGVVSSLVTQNDRVEKLEQILRA